MYAYPSRFPEDLIDTVRDLNNVCKYIDIPIQHISDNVLKSMRRGITKSNLIGLLEKLRRNIPGLALRTTLITGYPDETEKDFEELVDFVKEFRFDRLGVFTYSHEDDTFAATLPDRIPRKEKLSRQKQILDVQKEISHANNRNMIGKDLKILIDRKENDQYVGRSYLDAPEIDQEVFVGGENLVIGDFVNVKVYDAEEFDLFAEACDK